MRHIERVRFGPFLSEGTRLLWLELKRFDGNHKAVRELIGCPQPYLSKWLWADRRPGLPWAIAMQEKLGIDPKTWNQKPLERFNPGKLLAEVA